MTFSDSAEGREFVARQVDGTACAVLEAIALASASVSEAEDVLETGRLPGCGERQSHDRLYELVYRNSSSPLSELRWRGDTNWAVDAAGRLLENHFAGYVPAGHRRQILADENLTSFAAGDRRIAEQPDPVAGRSGRIWTHVSHEQIALAQRGAKAAQALAREIVLVRTEVDDVGGPAHMLRLTRDWLIDHDADPAGHAAVSFESGFDVWTVTMQRYGADGEPSMVTSYKVYPDSSRIEGNLDQRDSLSLPD